MRTALRFRMVGLVASVCVIGDVTSAHDYEEGYKWKTWLDMGGTFGTTAHLQEFVGPVSGQDLKLSPGFQMDLGFGYRPLPWLTVGPEFGMIFNSVEAFGDFSYHDTSLFQMPIMATLTLEPPNTGRLVPYIGGGIGGVASFLTFGANGDWEPDGTGSDFVLGFEAFAGFRYRVGPHTSLGVVYRFLATEPQNWDVEWWDHSEFRVGVGSIQVHSFCLVFTSSF